MKYTVKASNTDTVLNIADPVITIDEVTPPPDPNLPPTVNAGADVTITLPINSVTLNGSAIDSDGSISKYQWSKIGGGAAIIVSPTSARTSVTSLTEGLYTFQLAATDDDGVTSYDLVSVTVKAAVIIPPPTAGYELTYELNFTKPEDIDPDDHGQKGNSYLDNGWFRSRPADVSAGIRGEVQLDNNRLPIEGATEYEAQYLYVVQNQCHSFQIHGSTDGSSAILAMWHINGNFVVRTNSGGPNVSQSQPTKKIVVGQVYKIRWEYKIGASGYYRVYIDGQLYASYTGKIQNGSSQWIKLGFNGGFDNNKTEAMRSDIKYTNWKIYKKV